MTTNLIQARIDQILKFMTPAKLKFVNCHMVNYLTDDHWTNFIPKSIRDEVINGENDKTQELLEKFMSSKEGYDADLDDFPHTKAFVEETQNFTLAAMKEICLDLTEFRKEMTKIGFHMTDEPPLKIKDFMSAKKNHEVEITASLVNDLCKNIERISSEKPVIIDAGDGKGYLSSMLALQYGKFVLGIDASEINTQGAEKRKQKMSRAWKTLVKKAKNEHNNASEKEITIEGNYRPVTQFIDERTDFVEMAQSNFEQPFETFFLSGLHTCGNLASNSIKIYQNNPKIRGLCNIGCCYHFLVEEFGEDVFVNEQKYTMNKDSIGFPLSSYVKKTKIFLGRNARMHASQSLYRFFAEKSLPHQTLHYRAMLQVLLERKFSTGECSKWLVGKLKATNFEEYVNQSFDKFKQERPTKELIEEIEANFNEKLVQLQLFYILRLFLAPITESLIILDRLLFLREKGIEKSFIVELFDKVVSPRCYGIVSLKS
ncbi:probable methyltransferase-like protein 25 [Culicoides brevitarsis]|uniref:probable methyltransferase-like protein 25 n=1 Tax=Culicoides brevitarsis TaxID=469753 RepID=UPI00307CAC6C